MYIETHYLVITSRNFQKVKQERQKYIKFHHKTGKKKVKRGGGNKHGTTALGLP